MINTVESFLNHLGKFPKDKLPPDYNTPQVRRVFVYASFGFFNSLLAHVLLFIIFAFLSVKILALFNIISIILWAAALILIRKGYFWQGYTIGSIELIVHAALCVVIIGWDTGFQYYVLIHPALVFLSHWKLYVKVIISMIYGFTYIAMAHYAFFSNPLVELNFFYIAALNYGNITGAIIQVVAATYVYYQATITAEEKLEKEHQRTNEALEERNQALDHLNGELKEAADYVKKILPQPVQEGPIRTNWRFVPSTSLGGDAFGYHRIDDQHYAIYLIDVSGHGVGAALLSISVINVLRSQSLPKTEFNDPGQVLQSLNLAFPSASNKDMFFTMWYGVYNQNSRELAYASGGHPPAILFNGILSNGSRAAKLLRTPNYVVGGMSESTYKAERCSVGKRGTLYIFSDGVYEVEKADGSMWRFHEFTDYLQKILNENGTALDRLYDHARKLGDSETLEDDFTILEVVFN